MAQRYVAFFICSLLVWPHIFLDYVYNIEYVHLYTSSIEIPFANYAFFFLMVSIGVICLVCLLKRKLSVVGFPRSIQYAAGFFMVGLVISNLTWESLRLFLIIMTVSLSAWACGLLVFLERRISRPMVLVFLIGPCLFPILLSFFAEICASVGLEISFKNPKHLHYEFPRWRMLHKSANGFGFDAAIVALFGFCLVSFHQSLSLRWWIGTLLACVGLVALFFSGTRLAMLMLVAGVPLLNWQQISRSFHFWGTARQSVLFWIALLLLGVCSVLAVSSDIIIDYLRLEGDLGTITSTRSAGFLEMWFVLVERQFLQGIGFGAVNSDFTVHPNNLFFIGIMIELGLFGGVASAIFVLYISVHAIRIVRQLLQSCASEWEAVLVCFASIYVIGGLFWSVGEFELLRVSCMNQIYFFSLGIITGMSLHFREKDN